MPTKPAPIPLPTSPRKLSPPETDLNVLLAADSGSDVPSGTKTFFPSMSITGMRHSSNLDFGIPSLAILLTTSL